VRDDVAVTVETADRVNTNTVLAEVGACKILSQGCARILEGGGVCTERDGLRWCEVYGKGFTAGGNTVRAWQDGRV